MAEKTNKKVDEILITGAAGFIGSHLMAELIKDGWNVTGIDNFNDFYGTAIKHHRCEEFGLDVHHYDLKDFYRLKEFFFRNGFETVIHLAARPGVRDSFGNEKLYHADNIDGTQNLVQCCMHDGTDRVIYASTSSVYGETPMGKNGWTEDRVEGHQRNAYAYTKFVNEMQWKLSGVPKNIGLRFFTVYGEWGRPDMALFKFMENTLSGEPIDLYNNGNMKRDFTHISDVISGIKTVLNASDEIESGEIFNVGRGKQVELMGFLDTIETALGKTSEYNYLPRHPADTIETWSDVSKLKSLGWSPQTDVIDGVGKFIEWHRDFYGE